MPIPTQQRFWPDARPLTERLGKDFFLHLPQTAGVYLMRNSERTVLYIGKAKNLRRRLCSYRVANPDRMARRTLRLLQQVASIEWEECPDESAALRRESELLKTLKPRFNRAGVWPSKPRFILWRHQGDVFELALRECPAQECRGLGPFGGAGVSVFRTLVRLLWCQFHPGSGLAHLPAGWLEGRHGDWVHYHSIHAERIQEAVDRLEQLGLGHPSHFQEWLLPVNAPFEQPLRDSDLETLSSVFTRPLLLSHGDSLSIPETSSVPEPLAPATLQCFFGSESPIFNPTIS